MDSIRNELARIFSDSATHMAVAEIILKHLSNPRDVRAEALDALDLAGCHTIMDLGCGFGFFTMGLTDRVAPDAHITGIDCHTRYRDLYLDACKEAGIHGTFSPEGIQAIRSVQPGSVDLVICSYALYFFPEYIPWITRMLHPEGTFVIITHSRPHMKELNTFVKRILTKNHIPFHDHLPYEDLISHFSNQNGHGLLSQGFRKVKSRPYHGTLVFQHGDFDRFREYFMFKRTFFIPRNDHEAEKLMKVILDEIQDYMQVHGEISITKDDTIFVCNDPIH